jgi:tetratricopeptide (TPR) repeat protein
MIITSNQEEQFIVSPPQFHLEAPRESPFEAVPTATVTSSEGSFDFSWIQKPTELGIATVEGILEDIVQRSRRDAKRFPSSADVHANLGLALANCGRLTEAVDEFSTALKISPQHFMAMANLGRISASQGRFDEAQRIYEQIAKAHPQELSPLVNLSYIFLRTGKIHQATEILNRAIEVDSEALFPRYLMAVSLLTLGKSREAIRHLRFAARTEVRSPAVHQALGVAYLMAGDMKNAVRSFKTALTLAPEMKDAVHALANVLLRQGHTDSLVDLLAAYLQRQPSDITAREILSDAHSQLKQYPAARLQLTTALRQLQGDEKNNQKQKAKLLNNIGYCFDRQHDIEASAQWFSRSIQVDPTFDVVPYHNLAKVYVRKRQFAQAWQILEKCVEIFPDNHETPAVQAFVLSEQDRNDEAIELLNKELATGKASPSSYATLGWFLTDMKRDSKAAEQILFDGLKRYPQHPGIVNNLAYVALMQGHPVEARNVLSSLKTENREIQLEDRIYLTATWGLLHLWEGDIEGGRHCYEQAKIMSDESPQKHLAKIVQQKMHLELAKTFLRQNDIETALSEIGKGLSIREGRSCYEHDLISLIELLKNNSEPHAQ